MSTVEFLGYIVADLIYEKYECRRLFAFGFLLATFGAIGVIFTDS
jgi:hypothetical protein